MFWLACASAPESASAPVDTGADRTPGLRAQPGDPPDSGPFGEADPDPAGCSLRLDYDDDGDGLIDRYSEVSYDELGRWTSWELDDGDYAGRFDASWEEDCAVREEGALVDDEGDDWAVTLTRDCGEHGEATRETEVWAETQQGGGSVVYGDTTRWSWTWEGDRQLAVTWSSNDGETVHGQSWSWSSDLGPDSSEVDWLLDGVVDERWAWTWEEDGDPLTETQDGVRTTWERDTRDRITEISTEAGSSSRWIYLGLAADWPWVVLEAPAVTWWTLRC